MMMDRTGGLDAAGIVKRAEDSPHFRAAEELASIKGLRCFVGCSSGEPLCGAAAVMEVYGIPMCEIHGGEAAQGALEELYHDARQDLLRTLNPFLAPLNPAAVRALEEAERSLGVRVLHPELPDYDAALLRAFPLDRSRVDGETLAYIEHQEEYCDYGLPSDTFMRHRHTVHRLMRLAFQAEVRYIVESIEPHRVSAAEQAAYALALEREAGMW